MKAGNVSGRKNRHLAKGAEKSLAAGKERPYARSEKMLAAAQGTGKSLTTSNEEPCVGKNMLAAAKGTKGSLWQQAKKVLCMEENVPVVTERMRKLLATGKEGLRGKNLPAAD